MTTWFFALSLVLVTALTFREVRRIGMARALTASAAWIALAGVAGLRASITNISTSQLMISASICYVAVVLATGGRPVLIMDQIFEKEELTEDERRRGKWATWFVLIVITILAAFP